MNYKRHVTCGSKSSDVGKVAKLDCESKNVVRPDDVRKAARSHIS